MRSFASDNNSGVHPLIMQAVVDANRDHALGYGDDSYTEAATARLKELFGSSAEPYLVFNGTGANCVALEAVTRPFNLIICAKTAHINVDECGAPTRMTGCQIATVETSDGKLTPELIEPLLTNFGVCHHSQPAAVYISQVSELGTVYTAEQTAAIADLIHRHGMYLHMDGARLANACATLDCTMRTLTVDAGVDILSFGGTKNGMMMGEAVIAFGEELSQNLRYYRKQSAQLGSKMRYLAAQYIPYLSDDLWLNNARHANAMARRLADLLSTTHCVRFTQKVESNQLFFTMPREVTDNLLRECFFYMWDEANNEARLVTSWDTTYQDIDSFAALLNKALDKAAVR